MPGSGKSAVGRRLATRLDLPFVDADEEIEQAAGKPITDIFKDHGEAYFRDGERKVIARLLRSGPAGAGDGRRRVHGGGNARQHSPLGHLGLAEGGAGPAPAPRAQEKQPPAAGRSDPEGVMTPSDGGALSRLYATADITVESRDLPHEAIVGEIVDALASSPLLLATARGMRSVRH